MRNMEKRAAEGRRLITENRELTAGDLQQLISTAKEAGIYDALCNAFYSGYAAGHKAGKTAANGKA